MMHQQFALIPNRALHRALNHPWSQVSSSVSAPPPSPAVAAPPPADSPSKVRKSGKRRGVLDVLSFNRMSMAIVSAGAMQLSGAAFAQMQSPAPTSTATSMVLTGRAQEAFLRADANKDGKLSKQEAAALPAVAENFDKADTDKDGFLSQAEFAELVKEVGDAKEVKQ